MKKAVCLTMTLVLILLLCSCIELSSDMPSVNVSDDDYANARMEKLFNAIQTHNRTAVKSVFSRKAIAQVENFDKDINDLLGFIQGNLVSWEMDGSPMVYDRIEDGCKSKQLATWYKLETDEQSYLVFLVDYPIDTIDPENVGLYTLMIIKAEDEGNLDGYMEDWMIPGIYVMFMSE